MKRYPFGIMAALAGLALSPLRPSAAQEKTPLEQVLAARPKLSQKLSVEQAVAVAMQESPVIRGAVQEVEAAAGRLDAARAERRPWASLNTYIGGGSAANIVGSVDPVQPRAAMGFPGGRFFDQNLSVMVPVLNGGRLRAMVRQAEALRGASQAELAAMRQEVALLVRVAYREVLARRAYVEVNRAALEQNRERQRIDLVAYEQQKIPRFYTVRNEAEVANAQQMLTSAERDLEMSLVQLKTLMGVHLQSELELMDSLSFEPSSTLLAAYTPATAEATEVKPGADPALPALLAAAEKNRPELVVAARRIAAGGEEVKVAKNAYRPQIGVGIMGDLSRMKGEPLFGGSTFAVVGSLPILDGGARKARVHTATAERQKLEEERKRVALQVAQEVTTALLELRAAEKNVTTSQVAVKAAEEDYRVALLRYTSGKGINVEALDALAAQVRSQGNYVQALYEHNVARDRLARAVGILPTMPAQKQP